MNTLSLVTGLLVSFLATFGFAVLFSTPKKELVICGSLGAISYGVYYVLLDCDVDIYLATTIGIMVAMYISRCLTYIRKIPLIVYIVSSTIVFVPGAGIYYTMYYFVLNDMQNAVYYGIDTLKCAGAIALGVFIILSLPTFLIFRGFKFKKKIINN